MIKDRLMLILAQVFNEANMLKAYKALIPILFLTASCTNILPTAFWNKYESASIVENNSDQGPNGGHRAMHWKAKTGQTFSPEAAIAFAAENGWKLVGKENHTAAEVDTWKYAGQPVFPLSFTGFKPELSDAIYKEFPRWINGDLTIYRFKTNFVSIEPGTDIATEENGFILLNKENTEMSVYNIWGE